MLNNIYQKELKGLIEKRDEAEKTLETLKEKISDTYKRIVYESHMGDAIYETILKLLEHYEGGHWGITHDYSDDGDYKYQYFVNEKGEKIPAGCIEVDEYSVPGKYIYCDFYKQDYYAHDDDINERLRRGRKFPDYIQDFMDIVIEIRLNNINLKNEELENLYNYFIENYDRETRELKNNLEDEEQISRILKR